MAEKKKQHYVPKFYMKFFANEKKEIAVYNISDRRAIGIVPYKFQCYEDYFYGSDGVWENEFSELENSWKQVIEAVSNKEPLNDKQIKVIKEFAIHQRQRTYAEDKHNKQARVDLTKECGKLICSNKDLEFSEQLEKYCEDKAIESIFPAETMNNVKEYCDTVDDLAVLIINYTTKNELISSDTPVIAINHFHQQYIGYSCVGLILLFPVTEHQLVVIYDSKMYPRFAGKQYITMSNEKEVESLNILQMVSAEKILFGKSEQEFSKFNSFVWAQRSINRDKSSVTALGAANNKMIQLTTRKVIYDCKLSFARVSNNFEKIPFPCREGTSRNFDEKELQKLVAKMDIIPQISKFQPGVLCGLTKRDYRKGCQSMINAMKNYWRS